MVDTKVFGGKRYAFLYYRHTKKEATADAKRERLAGWNIRIVPQTIGLKGRKKTYYDLYGRRK